MGKVALSVWAGLQLIASSYSATLISAKTNAAITGAGGSFAPVFSPDGRYLAFQSHANNLVTNDRAGLHLDLFLYNFATEETRLISTSTNEPAGATGSAGYPSFSSNSTLLAFSTSARGLVPTDTNLVEDVYIRDLSQDTTVLVPLRSDPPGLVQTLGHIRPILSADASKVLFESTEQGLALHDIQQGSNLAVRVGFALRSDVIRAPPRPSMTPDARCVAFLSPNFDLSAYRSAGARPTDVFVRDTEAQVNYWISSAVTNYAEFRFDYQCLNPVISADGNVVVYKVSERAGSTNAWVFRHDLLTGQTVALSVNRFPWYSPADTTLSLSADGRFTAFERNGQIYLHDAQTGSHSVVSVQPSGQPGSGVSFRPVLTPDGTVIAFNSTAPNLLSPPVPGTNYQLYVRNLITGITRLASFNTNHQPSILGVRDAVASLGPDGLRVAFDYHGSDLAAGDYNSESDVFVYDWTSNSVTLISRRHSELPSSTGSWGTTGELSMSGDGRLLAYSAYDDPAVAGDSNMARDTFLADWTLGKVAPLFARSNDFSGAQIMRPILSASGHAALLIEQTYGGPFLEQGYTERLFWRNLLSGAVEEVDPEAGFNSGVIYTRTIGAAIGAGGRLVAYQKSGPLYLREMPSGLSRPAVTNRYSSVPFGQMIGPMFGANERWLTFRSHHGPSPIRGWQVFAVCLRSVVQRDLSGQCHQFPQRY